MRCFLAATAPPTMPTIGAQANHVGVPAGAEILQIRESSAHTGAYEVVTTAGTFVAYGQTPAIDQQSQRQRHDHRVIP